MIVTSIPSIINPNPVGDANTTYGVLFSPTSISAISHTISVLNQPVIAQAYGLTPSHTVDIEIVAGDGSGTLFAPFRMNGTSGQLNTDNTVFVLSVPGRYRFVLNGTLNVVTVVQFAATSSHEFTSAAFFT